MNDITKMSNNFLNSYIDENRNKIDESLVSLRLMKEVDDFLHMNNINHRDFANNIGYSEAYISQLMSGVKKFNASFINKLEKSYEIKIEFKINSRKDSDYISKISDSSIEINIEVNVKMFGLNESQNIFTLVNNQNETYELDENLYQLEM